MSDPFMIIRGRPTPQETAAVLAAVALVRTAPAGSAREPASGGWSAYWRAVGAPPTPGPQTWRAAARS